MKCRQLLTRISHEWLQRDTGRVSVQPLDAALANWSGVPTGVCNYSQSLQPRPPRRTQRRCLLLRSLRLPARKPRQPHEHCSRRAGRHPGTARLRFREIVHAATPLARVPRAFRLSRRMPITSLPRNSRRRTRPQLPLRRLQEILPPRRFTPAREVRKARRWPGLPRRLCGCP